MRADQSCTQSTDQSTNDTTNACACKVSPAHPLHTRQRKQSELLAEILPGITLPTGRSRSSRRMALRSASGMSFWSASVQTCECVGFVCAGVCVGGRNVCVCMSVYVFAEGEEVLCVYVCISVYVYVPRLKNASLFECVRPTYTPTHLHVVVPLVLHIQGVEVLLLRRRAGRFPDEGGEDDGSVRDLEGEGVHRLDRLIEPGVLRQVCWTGERVVSFVKSRARACVVYMARERQAPKQQQKEHNTSHRCMHTQTSTTHHTRTCRVRLHVAAGGLRAAHREAAALAALPAPDARGRRRLLRLGGDQLGDLLRRLVVEELLWCAVSTQA